MIDVESFNTGMDKLQISIDSFEDAQISRFEAEAILDSYYMLDDEAERKNKEVRFLHLALFITMIGLFACWFYLVFVFWALK